MRSYLRSLGIGCGCVDAPWHARRLSCRGMARQPATRLQISGDRFMRRRIECALLGIDLRAVNESVRAPARSLTVGLVFAIVLLAGCLVLATAEPSTERGDGADFDGATVGSALRSVGRHTASGAQPGLSPIDHEDRRRPPTDGRVSFQPQQNGFAAGHPRCASVSGTTARGKRIAVDRLRQSRSHDGHRWRANRGPMP